MGFVAVGTGGGAGLVLVPHFLAGGTGAAFAFAASAPNVIPPAVTSDLCTTEESVSQACVCSERAAHEQFALSD